MAHSLNSEQLRAVTHSGSPLLIVAGPGSGKTRVIVERIKHLISKGTKPSEVLCLTFSEKAADEMKRRLDEISDISDMQISTFHSFSKDLLQDNVLLSGIGISSGVMSRASQLVWGLKNIDTYGFKHIEIGNNAVEVIESVIDGISTCKDELVDYHELNTYVENKLKQDLDEEQKSFLLRLADLAKVYKKYQEFQRIKGFIDFDDMVVETVKLLRRRSDIAKKYQQKFKHIFVDEFQDNNYAQLELVKLLSSNGNVTAVGDDDQCIYRFQGAYLTNFKDFSIYFKNTTIITLNQNYRSSGNIIKLADQLLEGVQDRQPKKLFSENDDGEKISLTVCSNENSEVEFVVNTIKSLIGKIIKRRDGSNKPLTYSDFVILSRKKVLGQKFAMGLKAHGIPVISVGESNLFAMPIVRDFMCYLRIANDLGRAGMEITRLLTLVGITEQNIAEINRIAKKKAYSDTTDVDFVFETLNELSTLNVTQKHTLEEVVNQIEDLTKIANSESLSGLIYKIIMSISGIYKESLVSNTPEDQRNRLILRELHRISTEFEKLNPHGTLSEFITHLSLMGEFDIELEEGNEFDDAVRVTTIHQSKGKEFPIVFITDVAANKLPLRYQAKKFYVPRELSKGIKVTEDEKELYIQEERRLLFVAITRAQNMLFLSYAQKYGDNIRESKPSRFLDELNHKTNPLINIQQFSSNEKDADSLVIEGSRVEHLKTELQNIAIRSICQMNVKTAIERLMDLSKLKYYEENGTTDGFDPRTLLDLDYDNNQLDKSIKNIRVPLINKEKLKLSASKLDTYKRCPLKFKFAHILEIPTPAKAFFDLGTSVHAVVEQLGHLEEVGGEVTEKIAFEILDKEWIANSYRSETEANQAKEKARDMLRVYLNWKDANPNKFVSAEEKFTITLGGIPVNGSIDRVEKTPQGEYVVIDFKTGGVSESNKSIKENIQMNIYAIATETLYKKLPTKTSLFYLKKDKIISNNIEKSSVQEFKRSIEDKVKLILEEEFTATPSFEVCRSCDYQSICDNKKIK